MVTHVGRKDSHLKLDRRRHPRSMVSCMLAIERLDMPGGLAHLWDISLGGLRFQCVGFNLVMAEVLQVQFNLGRDMFNLFGFTVRVRKLDAFAQEVALTFNNMAPEDQAFLRRRLHDS